MFFLCSVKVNIVYLFKFVGWLKLDIEVCVMELFFFVGFLDKVKVYLE